VVGRPVVVRKRGQKDASERNGRRLKARTPTGQQRVLAWCITCDEERRPAWPIPLSITSHSPPASPAERGVAVATNKSPAFLFYVNDWRSSRRVQAMSFAERGMYLELLCEQWDKGSVPGSADECTALFGGATVAEWRRAWQKLRPCFAAKSADGLALPRGRLVNPKLEAVRIERDRFVNSQRESGKRGAEARWGERGEAKGSPSEPTAPPMPKNGSWSDLIWSGSRSDFKEGGPEVLGTTDRESHNREGLPFSVFRKNSEPTGTVVRQATDHRCGNEQGTSQIFWWEETRTKPVPSDPDPQNRAAWSTSRDW
jgi:hypothetical protein